MELLADFAPGYTEVKQRWSWHFNIIISHINNIVHRASDKFLISRDDDDISSWSGLVFFHFCLASFSLRDEFNFLWTWDRFSHSETPSKSDFKAEIKAVIATRNCQLNADWPCTRWRRIGCGQEMGGTGKKLDMNFVKGEKDKTAINKSQPQTYSPGSNLTCQVPAAGYQQKFHLHSETVTFNFHIGNKEASSNYYYNTSALPLCCPPSKLCTTQSLWTRSCSSGTR